MKGNDNQVSAARAAAHGRAIGRWENEGGASKGGLDANQTHTVAGEIGDVEEGNIRVRLIALENIVVALLANTPGEPHELVREMAAYISPRPGMTPHRLTVEAARNMLALVERAAHYEANE